MANKQQPNRLIEDYAGVDWLTGTANISKSRETVTRLAHSLLEDGISEGQKPRVWSSYGYTGWMMPGIRWGRRDQDDLISLSGETAASEWELFVPFLTNISRIDLQVTCKMAEHDIALASRAYEAIRAIALDLPIIRSYTMITNLLGGDTLYIGKRSSIHMGRLYDKSFQSRDRQFANCWRYEVEYKGAMAWKVATILAGTPDVYAEVKSLVHDWFSQRLVKPVFHVISTGNVMQIKRRKTADEKALEWLYAQVRPTVERLIQRGKLEGTISALGLSYKDLKGGS